MESPKNKDAEWNGSGAAETASDIDALDVRAGHCYPNLNTKGACSMKAFVITVDFKLHPGRGAEFLPLMTANAKASADNEPGCRRFDVLVPHKGADWVRLYEIYDSEAAFDDHRK